MGVYLGALTVLLALLAIADCSLLPRPDRAVEADAGAALHYAPGVFAV